MHFLNSGRMALQAQAPRQEPKQRNATLTWFDIQNIQTATCWAGGFTHHGKFKMLVYVGQNSRLFSLLQMKRIKSENGRTFLQVFTGCSESVPGCQTWQLSVYRPSMRKKHRLLLYYRAATFDVEREGTGLQATGQGPAAALQPPPKADVGKKTPSATDNVKLPEKCVGKKKKIRPVIISQGESWVKAGRDVTLCWAFLK